MNDTDGETGGNFLLACGIGAVLSWNEVSNIHRSRNGIYQSHGKLASLLTDFGIINPCYPDFHGDTKDIIYYTGSGRRGNQKLDAANRALLNAINAEFSVPLFNKLGVNRWEYLGQWNVIDSSYIFDENQSRMVWKFTLKRYIN